MKKQLNIKKLILLNLPYILMGLFSTNFGEAWRMAVGADASAKMLSFFSTLPVALTSWWPSLHSLDLLVGLCCGGGLRLAVYLKSKNAKKYRHGIEYGSACWGTREDIAPYVDPVFQNNVILTKTESLTMNSRPKDPKTARNKNVLVIGGSGSGKTRFWLKPNLMQMHSSYVVTDPKGTILVECGKMLQRGAPKLGKDGKPMKDKHGKVIYEPYRIKVLNTINFKKSMHYKPSHREQLRVMIDNALSQSPADFEELLKLLQEYGCEVSKRGKSYRLKLSGWEKAARMDSLGEGYGLEDLRAVLLGKKAHTPRKKTVTQAEPPKINLLVDIQAKLQAGKGAGYARWAKVFNLKQMAQTMNYLSEHNLLEYAVLEEKAAAATAHHNELSAQIKAAEKRMAEIAVLRTHIVNYAKTREVYVAYRKAGYSKKFREEHEEEILLHQAAKNAFDEMGVKKLPKVKELQTEYAKLLEEKKKTYAEYRHSREEMRELLTAKANVDRVLKMEVEQDVEKEKDHGQR